MFNEYRISPNQCDKYDISNDSPNAIKMSHPLIISTSKQHQKLQHIEHLATLDSTFETACVNPR